jgi:hypothetical protein
MAAHRFPPQASAQPHRGVTWGGKGAHRWSRHRPVDAHTPGSFRRFRARHHPARDPVPSSTCRHRSTHLGRLHRAVLRRQGADALERHRAGADRSSAWRSSPRSPVKGTALSRFLTFLRESRKTNALRAAMPKRTTPRSHKEGTALSRFPEVLARVPENDALRAAESRDLEVGCTRGRAITPLFCPCGAPW